MLNKVELQNNIQTFIILSISIINCIAVLFAKMEFNVFDAWRSHDDSALSVSLKNVFFI